MIYVNGIILILSCNKHKNTRLKKFKLDKDEYENWKVIYVIGDLFLDSSYKLDGNILTIKCEDSYIHLLKKLVLSLKYLYEIFNIKEGILRCGDDLIFNQHLLQNFLKSPKNINNEDIDFIGKSTRCKDLLSKDISDDNIKLSKFDNFMVEYYNSHPEDFENPQHNLKNVDITKYIKRPHLYNYIKGVIYYISNKACKILINHLDNIKYNIFHYDEYSNSYPYTIEDCAVSFILYNNKIGFIHNDKMYYDDDDTIYDNIYDDNFDNESYIIDMKKNNTDYIAIHTNYYR